jgi:hypothetical protein
MTDFSSGSRSRRGRWDTPVLAVGGLLFAGAVVSWWQASSDLRERRTAVERANGQATAAAERARSLEVGQGTAAAALASQAVGTLDAPPPQVIADLSSAMPSEVRIESLDLDYRDRVLLDFRVRARSPEAYDAFLERLTASPRFAEIVPGPETRGPELSASVRASYRYGASR